MLPSSEKTIGEEGRFLLGIEIMKARKLVTVAIAIIIVFITVFLAIGYTQPYSRIRVEVYNVWHTGASIMVFIDNVTNGKVYEVPSEADMILGVWSVHAGTHNVTIVSDDFPHMVYNTKELYRIVYAWPYETVTAFWGLALI